MKYWRQFAAWLRWVTQGRVLMERRIDELIAQRIEFEMKALRSEIEHLRDIVGLMNQDKAPGPTESVRTPRSPAEWRRFLSREEESAVA